MYKVPITRNQYLSIGLNDVNSTRSQIMQTKEKLECQQNKP